MTEFAYPIQWPAGRPRTERYLREDSRFQVTPAQAQKEMLAEIEMMGGSEVVLTTDMRVKRDGSFFARDLAGGPIDSGIAVYFVRKGVRVCFCCDRYARLWENMRAIGLTVNAMRAIERHGTAEMLDRAFTGFAALPAPGAADWWTILGVSRDATVDQISAAYKAKARELGASGNDAARAELNVARDKAIKERG